MQEIQREIKTFLSGSRTPQDASIKQVRKDSGFRVSTHRELMEKVAELAFANPEFVLLYRGQTKDYPERNLTTLFPSIFRPSNTSNSYARELKKRYQELRKKEEELIELFGYEYEQRFSRNSFLRLTVLQHYGICLTPLLDLTHSLLVAASFAFVDDSNTKDPYLYVLGLPQISGSITVVSDQSLQIMRLGSLCPPTALRPYFQEGYLIGTFPTIERIDQKMEYPRREVDCANRLIAKFRLKRKGFWGNGFNLLNDEALYPVEQKSFNQRIAKLYDK